MKRKYLLFLLVFGIFFLGCKSKEANSHLEDQIKAIDYVFQPQESFSIEDELDFKLFVDGEFFSKATRIKRNSLLELEIINISNIPLFKSHSFSAYYKEAGGWKAGGVQIDSIYEAPLENGETFIKAFNLKDLDMPSTTTELYIVNEVFEDLSAYDSDKGWQPKIGDSKFKYSIHIKFV